MTTRQIWDDLQNEIRELSRNEFPTEDPRDNNVNSNVRATEPEPIEIKGVDWNHIGVEIVGQPDFGEPLERVTDEDIEADWAGGKTSDSCAWYESYHYNRTHWGIHFSEYCVISVAEKIWRHRAQTHYKTQIDAIKGALLFLFLHEFFHYITDNASAVLEIVSGTPDLYDNYSVNVYMKTYSSPGALEEALAERYLYGRAERICKLKDKDYLTKVLLNGPPGYRDFFRHRGPRFWEGRRDLMSMIFSGNPSPIQKPIEQVMELLEPSAYRRGHRVPLWMHYSPKRLFRIYNI